MRYSCKGDSSQRQLNLSAAASPDVLRSAAEAGAEIVRTAVQGQISSQAKNPTGKLLSSITYRSWSNEASSGAMLGWAQIAVARAGYRNHGRNRSVRTTDDYGRILEYSSKRVLRHFEPGFEESEEAALSAMEQRIDSAIASALGEAEM